MQQAGVLPYPWEARVSQSNGDTYYVNSQTGESQWSLPTTVLKAQQSEQQKVTKKQRKKKKKQKKNKKKLPNGWETRVSRSTGETYFFHLASEVSQFEFPRPLAKGWTYAKSHSTGDTYYVCESGPRAGERTYDHPGYGDEREETAGWCSCCSCCSSRPTQDGANHHATAGPSGPAWAAASAAQSRERPDTTPTAPTIVDDPSRELKPGWSRTKSRTTGETYYLDEHGNSTFDHPGYAQQLHAGTSPGRQPVIIPGVGPAPIGSAAGTHVPRGRMWDVPGTLTVRVIRCLDLMPVDTATGFASPKVELVLVEGAGQKPQTGKTSTVERTLNPTFTPTDVFKFELRGSSPASRPRSCELKVTVWDYNRVGKDDFMGEVNIDLPAELGGNAVKCLHHHTRWPLVDSGDQIPFSKRTERGASAYPLGVVELELAFVPEGRNESEKLAVADEVRRHVSYNGEARPAPSLQATLIKLREPQAPHKHRHHREAYIADGRLTLVKKTGCLGLRTKHDEENLLITNFEHQTAVKAKTPGLAFTIHTSNELHENQPLVVVAKDEDEKHNWLRVLDATVEHNRQRLAAQLIVSGATAGGGSSATVDDTAESLALRRRNAESAARKIHSRMEVWGSAHAEAPLQDKWTVGGPIDRRLLQKDDRDIEGRQLVLEMIESLRGSALQPGVGGHDRSLAREFTDRHFPHVWTSIANKSEARVQAAAKSALPFSMEMKARVEWKRPHEIGTRGIEAVVLHPDGALVNGDQMAYNSGRLPLTHHAGWLAATFCCVIAQPRAMPFVIQNIISTGHDIGLYAVRLFINGRWITVLVDDYFPCEKRIDGDGQQWQWRTLFAGPREVNAVGMRVKEFWPCIIEKAWAKYCGSYEAALGPPIRTEEAAAVLTGGIAKTYAVGPLTDAEQSDARVSSMPRLPTWESVRDLLHQGGQMCCCRLRQERVDAALAVAGNGLPFSVFALIGAANTSQGRLLRLCTPWRSSDEVRWGERFVDNLVWTADLRRECEHTGCDIPAGRCADDCFWLVWEDFLVYFEEIGVCTHWCVRGDDSEFSGPPKQIYCSTALGEWKSGVSAGGKAGLTTCRHNPRFRAKIHDKDTYLVNENIERELHIILYPNDPPQDVHLYRLHKEGSFTLKVTIVEANGLPRLGVAKSCNPFVKMRVTHGAEAQRTSVVQNTSTPRWLETFDFELIESADLSTMELTLEAWSQNLGGTDQPIGKHSVRLAPIFAVQGYEQWLKLEHGDVDGSGGSTATPCGELLISCKISRQNPQLDEILHCCDRPQVANLMIPTGERYLSILAATSEPGLEGTFSFSVRTFDGSPCTVEALAPCQAPEEWERKNMVMEPTALAGKRGTRICAMCRGQLNRETHWCETHIGPVHRGECYESVKAMTLPASWRPVISHRTGERTGGFHNQTTGEVVMNRPTGAGFGQSPTLALSVVVVKANGLSQHEATYAKICVIATHGISSPEYRTTPCKSHSPNWRNERFRFVLAEESNLMQSQLRVQFWQVSRSGPTHDKPVGQCTVQIQSIVGDSVGSFARWLPLVDLGDAAAASGLETLIRCEIDHQAQLTLRSTSLRQRPFSPQSPAGNLQARRITVGNAAPLRAPLKLKGGVAAEKQVEATKANIRAAVRDELYRGAQGVDLSKQGIDAELMRMGVEVGLATYAQRREAKQRLILQGPTPSQTETEAMTRVLSKFDVDRLGALTLEQFRSMMLRFKAERFKGERLQPLQRLDYMRLFDYLDEETAGELSLSEVSNFVQSGTLGARLQQELLQQQQDHLDLSADYTMLRVPDKEERRVLFAQWDGTGSSKLSLAEIDKGITHYPPRGWEPIGRCVGKSQVLAAAYKAADSDYDGSIGRHSFKRLLQAIVFCYDAWKRFSTVDSNSDGRIDFAEFEASCAELGLHTLDARAEFDEIDTNRSGAIMFTEFISWVGQRKLSPATQVHQDLVDANFPRRRHGIASPSRLRQRPPQRAGSRNKGQRNARRPTSPARLPSSSSFLQRIDISPNRHSEVFDVTQEQQDLALDCAIVESNAAGARSGAATSKRSFGDLPARFGRAVRLLRQAAHDAPSSSIVRGDWIQVQRVLDNELGSRSGSVLSVRDCGEVLASIGLVLNESQLNATIQNMDENSSFEVDPGLLMAVIEEAFANSSWIRRATLRRDG